MAARFPIDFRALSPDLLRYRWDGHYHSRTDESCMLAWLKLTVAMPPDAPDGLWRLWQLRGWATKGHDDSRPSVRFGTEPMFKVANDARGRRGWIVGASVLAEDEEARPADREFVADERLAAYAARPQGEWLRLLLSDMAKCPTETSEPWAPEFVLRRRISEGGLELHPAADPDTRHLIMSDPSYDTRLPYEANARSPEMLERFGTYSGYHVGLPFRHYHGKGVVACLPDGLGEWRATERGEFVSLPWLRVSYEGYGGVS